VLPGRPVDLGGLELCLGGGLEVDDAQLLHVEQVGGAPYLGAVDVADHEPLLADPAPGGIGEEDALELGVHRHADVRLPVGVAPLGGAGEPVPEAPVAFGADLRRSDDLLQRSRMVEDGVLDHLLGILPRAHQRTDTFGGPTVVMSCSTRIGDRWRRSAAVSGTPLYSSGCWPIGYSDSTSFASIRRLGVMLTLTPAMS